MIPMSSKHVIHCVLTLAIVLSSSGCWQIGRPEQHPKEALLKEDLYALRNAIDQFTEDKNAAPQSLDDLVHAGYLRELPIDPFTGSRTTWRVVLEEVDVNAGSAPRGITDVHSGSHAIGKDGTPYDTW
jgi:general secretion pathway protein G